MLNSAIKSSLFIHQTFSSTWQIVQYFDGSRIHTFMKKKVRKAEYFLTYSWSFTLK